MTLAVSMAALFRAAMWAGVLGVMLALLYDGIRLTRMLCGVSYGSKFFHGFFCRRAQALEQRRSAFAEKHGLYRRFLSVYVALGDVLFFLFAGVVYSIFLYWANHGIFRFLFLLFTVLGFALYRKTVGRFLFFLLRELAALTALCLFFAWKLIKVPIFFVYSVVFVKVFRVFLLLLRKFCGIIRMKVKAVRRKRVERRRKP